MGSGHPQRRTIRRVIRKSAGPLRAGRIRPYLGVRVAAAQACPPDVSNREAIVDEMDWALASKYLAAECTDAERQHFEKWLAGAPERRVLLDSLRPLYAVRATAGVADVDAAWTSLSARLDRELVQARRGGAPQHGWRRTLGSRPWRVAAAAGIVLAAAVSVPIVARLMSPAPVAIVTGPGERRAMTLPDGSRIDVAPLSRLTLDGDRRVTLDGEARFTVVHDEAHPFTVRTSDATIEDLGTVFVVRAVAGDEGTRVAVEEGVVALAARTTAHASRALVLRARESGRVVADSGAVRADSVTWARGVAWTRGEIVFDRTPLHEVASELHRWFGVTVQLADPSLATRTLSARLSAANLDEALAAIERSLGASHTRRGDTVTIRP